MRKLKTKWLFNFTREGQPTSILPFERDIVDDLRAAGLDVFTTQQLRDAVEPYSEAIPILIKHLEKKHDERVRDNIIRSLTVKEAKGVAFEPLYEAYINETDDQIYGVKDSEANALRYLAEKKDIPKLIELVLNPKYGRTRIYLIDKIASSAGKTNMQTIKDCLLKLTMDSDKYIVSNAKKALARKKFTE